MSGAVGGFDEQFEGSTLDPTRWIDHYLPQWTTAERSRARFRLDGTLTLLIEADQPPWRPEDGELRVSNLQTATFSGPVGSERGTHRHVPGMTVRTAVERRELWTPSGHGHVEVELAASSDPDCLTAVWLVGVEQRSPDDSGEITVVELFGSAIGPTRSTVRLGVKAINDPRLTTDIADVELPMDASTRHRYGADWDEGGIRLVVDGQLVRTIEQRLDYPLQLMIDLFEQPGAAARDPSHYPKSATVFRVRAGTEPRVLGDF